MSEWMEGLSEDLQFDTVNDSGETVAVSAREHPKLAEFKTLDDFAKSYLHAQDALGQPALRPLKEDASDEEKAEFQASLRQMIGAGEKPEDYSFELGETAEVNEKMLDWFKTQAAEQGLTPAQAQSLVANYDAMAKEMWDDFEAKYQEAQEQEILEKRKSSIETLSKIYGHDVESAELKDVLETARRGFDLVGSKANLPEETLVEFKKKFGDIPEFVQIFHALGSLVQEDSFVSPGQDGRDSDNAKPLAQRIYPNMNP